MTLFTIQALTPHCRHRSSRRSISTAGLGTSICVLLAIVACERHHMEPLSANAAIIPESEWPQVIIDVSREAGEKRIDAGLVRVYHVSEEEYFLECRASPELLALMTARWELLPVKENHAMVRRFRERLPLESQPSISEDVDYFLSANWLAGEKGHLFCLMNDKAHKRVVVRYYYNF